jgi:hypothetical protein
MDLYKRCIACDVKASHGGPHVDDECVVVVLLMGMMLGLTIRREDADGYLSSCLCKEHLSDLQEMRLLCDKCRGPLGLS